MNEKMGSMGDGQIGRRMCRLLKKRDNDVIAYDKSKMSLFQKFSVCVAVNGKYSVIRDTLMSDCGVDDRPIFDYVQII